LFNQSSVHFFKKRGVCGKTKKVFRIIEKKEISWGCEMNFKKKLGEKTTSNLSDREATRNQAVSHSHRRSLNST